MGHGGGAVPRAWTLGFPIKEQVTRQAVQPAPRRGGLSGARPCSGMCWMEQGEQGDRLQGFMS